MKYVKAFDVLGIETAQIPCIELNGVPNAATKGAVGLLGIDITSSEYELYKCVKVEGSVYTWMPVVRGKDGTCVTKAEIDINEELVLTLSDGTTLNVGVVKGEKGESGVDGNDGVDGVSVTNTQIDNAGNLIVTLSNGETITAGIAKGEQGVSVVKMELTVNNELVVTFSNGIVTNLGVLNMGGEVTNTLATAVFEGDTSTLNLTLPDGEILTTGKQITFKAPCDSSAISLMTINGVCYSLVDSQGDFIIEMTDVFSSNAMISIIIDVEDGNAFIQNPAVSTRKARDEREYHINDFDLSLFEDGWEYGVRFRDFVLPSVVINYAIESYRVSCVNHYAEDSVVYTRIFQLIFNFAEGVLEGYVYEVDPAGNVLNSENIKELENDESIYLYKK